MKIFLMKKKKRDRSTINSHFLCLFLLLDYFFFRYNNSKNDTTIVPRVIQSYFCFSPSLDSIFDALLSVLVHFMSCFYTHSIKNNSSEIVLKMAKNYPSFIVDAFTTQSFAGNPAAVCLIPQVVSLLFDMNKRSKEEFQKLKDEEYLKISSEFNLSETAFPVPIGPLDFKQCSQFSLRWFTPKTEVPLCGHATLATSHVLFNEVGNVNEEIKFDTQSGVLIVKRGDSGNVEMDFAEYDLTSMKFNDTPNPLHGILSEVSFRPKSLSKYKVISVRSSILPSQCHQMRCSS